MRQLQSVAFAIMTLAIALAIGCKTSGGSQSAGTIAETDFAQVPAAQMGPVDQARQSVARANDEQARAQLRLKEAQQEDQLAAADQKSAKAAMDQAKTKAQIAGETRDPSKIELAGRLSEQAGMQQRAADARSDYAKKLIDARQTSVAAADKKTALQEAKLEVAKLEALRGVNSQAAGKYDMAGFQQRVQKAQGEYQAADQKAKDQEWWAQQAHRTYGDAKSEFQAQTSPSGTPQTGTGSR